MFQKIFLKLINVFHYPQNVNNAQNAKSSKSEKFGRTKYISKLRRHTALIKVYRLLALLLGTKSCSIDLHKYREINVQKHGKLETICRSAILVMISCFYLLLPVSLSLSLSPQRFETGAFI
jgi:FtsH-binding integral membrane protein